MKKKVGKSADMPCSNRASRPTLCAAVRLAPARRVFAHKRVSRWAARPEKGARIGAAYLACGKV